MKRLLIVFIVALLLVLGVPRLVFAGAGPHGGDYTATTDACAGCHRAHTATGSNLLLNSTEALCLTCHGNTGNGADTNVTDGIYLDRDTEIEVPAQGTVNDPLLGGGFSFYRVQGQGSFSAVTSTHDIGGTAVDAWGYGSANTGQTAALASGLTCGTCHDPHGNTTNYRIIRSQVNGVPVSVTTMEGTDPNFTTENWGTGMSEFCAACHSNYNDGGSINTGGVVHFRHDMNMNYSVDGNQNPETVGYQGYYLPLANTAQAGGDTVVCTTCHLSHGTSATQEVNSAAANITGDSSLLRLENRGVCEVCHQL